MSEHPENTAILCAIGTMLLMFALGSTIFLGISPLTTQQPYTYPNYPFQYAVLFVVAFSLLGGYLVSYGLIIAFRGKQREENVQPE